ncbi:DUF5009 domain-containing protein [Scytonema sp. UIC 10036]|uniref:DUF5009 domain-containing protein n=1 Tax=Scytonema sp. UIC 10036 TaxID=2304196 RepID=UPI0012DAB331|nr:DUF5009 domain-containing protein [Scytonema sp. UIC 10036]MUG92428.1 DUF5009 domain-containing protein [Scytonema sp. UIC 10036]
MSQNVKRQNPQKIRKSENRVLPLDALRGFAVLAMVLSGTISYEILPAWMYHAQKPPPTHAFNPQLPGLTWVDIVFPLFLFSLGAAIPIALSNRLSQGFAIAQILIYIFKRGFLLGAFAVFLEHFRPLRINDNPTDQTWWIALLGFFLLFFMFVRWSVNEQFQKDTRRLTFGAWLAAIILVFSLQYPEGNKFSLLRNDIILVVLAYMAVFGAIAWLCTKNNVLLRLGLLGFLIAIRFSATVKTGWISALLAIPSISWMLQLDYLKYLFIVIPGTIAGDLILKWLQAGVTHTDEERRVTWARSRFYGIVILMLAICVNLLVGLQARWVEQTILLSIIFCFIGWFFFKNPLSETERLLTSFFHWGVYWLVLGLIFEPFEGGIKKDPSTLSYYFVATSISLFLLIIFTLLLDVLKQQKLLQLFIDNGQNPTIAYVAFANLLLPIFKLTKIEMFISQHTNTPLTGFLKGVLYTSIIACFVSFLSKQKVFWKI